MYSITTVTGQTLEDFFCRMPILFYEQLVNKLIILKQYESVEEVLGWLIYRLNDKYFFTLEDIEHNIFYRVYIEFDHEKNEIVILNLEQ